MPTIASIEIQDSRSNLLTAEWQLIELADLGLLHTTGNQFGPDLMVYLGYNHHPGDIPELDVAPKPLVILPELPLLDMDSSLEVFLDGSSHHADDNDRAREVLKSIFPSRGDQDFWIELLGRVAEFEPTFAVVPNYRLPGEFARFAHQSVFAEVRDLELSIMEHAGQYFEDGNDTIREIALGVLSAPVLNRVYLDKINHILMSGIFETDQALAFLPPGFIGLPEVMNEFARRQDNDIAGKNLVFHSALGKLATGPGSNLALVPSGEGLAQGQALRGSRSRINTAQQYLFRQFWFNHPLVDDKTASDLFGMIPSGDLFDEVRGFYIASLPSKPTLESVGQAVKELENDKGWKPNPAYN